MTHKMRALTLVSPGHVDICEKPIPDPGPGEVLLKVESTTVCGTDLRLITGEKTTGVRPGVTLGHEIAGRVAEVGHGVDPSLVGRQATVSIVVSCGRCRACLLGREHLCEHLSLIGYGIDGGLAPYLLVPRQAVARGNLMLTPTEMAPQRLALAEPLSCVLNGHSRHHGINPGETVVVIGGGAIGLLHAQLALRCGAKHVIVGDPHEDRRARARQIGAMTAAPGDLARYVSELTDDWGAEVVIVAVGRDELVDQSLSMAAPGGRVSWFAGFPQNSTAHVSANSVHYRELEVTGGSNARRADVRRAITLLDDQSFNHELIVTQTYTLEEWKTAFADVRERRGLKIAIDPSC